MIEKTNSLEKKAQTLKSWELLWNKDPRASSLTLLPLAFQKAYSLQVEYFDQTSERGTPESTARRLFIFLLKIYERALSQGPSFMRGSLMQRTHSPVFFKTARPGQEKMIEWWLDAFDWLEDRGTRLSQTNRSAWLERVLADSDLTGEKNGIH